MMMREGEPEGREKRNTKNNDAGGIQSGFTTTLQGGLMMTIANFKSGVMRRDEVG